MQKERRPSKTLGDHVCLRQVEITLSNLNPKTRGLGKVKTCPRPYCRFQNRNQVHQGPGRFVCHVSIPI